MIGKVTVCRLGSVGQCKVFEYFGAEFLELRRIGGLLALVSLGLTAWDIDMDVAVRVLWTERLECQLYSDQGPKAWGFLRLFQIPTVAISRLHTQTKTQTKPLVKS